MASRAGQVTVKQGSLGRAWVITLDELDPTDARGQRRRPVDLTLLDAAELRYKPGPAPGVGVPLGGPCTVLAPGSAGQLAFSPGPEDVAVAGEFGGVLYLTWLPEAGIPSPEIVPHKGYLGIVVEPV